MNPETPNATPAQPEQESPVPITVPEGLLSSEEQSRINEILTTPEPIVNEAQKAIAEARMLEEQRKLQQASDQAVHAAKTANAARRVDAA